MKYEVYGQYDGEHACISQEHMEYLAEKIVSGKVLTVSDRILLYTAITGDPHPESLFQSKKGPKKKITTLRKLAEDFILLKSQKMRSTEIMKVLGAKYDLQGGSAVLPTTFYKALKKGRIELISFEERQLNSLKIRERYKQICAIKG